MVETNFMSYIIQDILSTRKYTLQEIAEHINFHESAIIDIIIGKNISPSSIFIKRIIELHHSVKTKLRYWDT